MMTVMRLRYW